MNKNVINYIEYLFINGLKYEEKIYINDFINYY